MVILKIEFIFGFVVFNYMKFKFCLFIYNFVIVFVGVWKRIKGRGDFRCFNKKFEVLIIKVK